MNTDCRRINQIFSYHLFETSGNQSFFQASIGKTLPHDVKDEVLEYYRTKILSDGDNNPHNPPIDQRDIGIVRALPNLARDPDFLVKLENHAANFCKNFMPQAHSSGIKSALDGMKPIATLTDAETFLESILSKKEDNQPITDNEKKIFKLLLTGMLKMHHSLDAENSSSFLKALTKYAHPDITSQKKSDLYACILSKGVRIARVINDLWYIEPIRKSAASPHKSNIPAFSDDQLLEAIVSLRSLKDIDASVLFNKIRIELQSRTPVCQKDNFKENLLKLIIEINEIRLLEILLNRPDFDISEVKIGNETPLIYAIQTADSRGRSAIIRALINNDTNTLGLKGKTPLQVAIDYYQKFPVKYVASSGYPYQQAIGSLLNCPNLCVDSKDSTGLTALCYFALFPEINPVSLKFITKLINLGANVDHPIPGCGTVRTLLRDKLNRNQFADLESLANNSGSYQQ